MGDQIKSGRKESFTVLYNSMITDKRLSLKAKGLFAVMMSRPENWEFSVSGLAAFSGVGKDSIRATLAELENVGYLIRSQAHDSGGKFAGNIYVLQDIAPPLSENTDDGKNRQRESTLSGNPTQRNKDYKEKKKYIPPVSPMEVLDAVDAYIGDDPEYEAAFMGFLENRNALKKPVKTARAINGIINKLRKVNCREIEIAMLDKATERNWLTVYPLKPDEISSGGSSSRVIEEDGVTYI